MWTLTELVVLMLWNEGRTATQVPLPCPVYCSQGLWVLAKTNNNKTQQFCELVSYLTLDRLLSESGRAISRNLLVLIIVQ